VSEREREREREIVNLEIGTPCRPRGKLWLKFGSL